MPAPLAPVTLTGRTIALEPLTRDHAPDLATVAVPELFRWWTVRLDTPEDMRRWVDDALAAHGAGTALPFATVLLDGRRVIGSTRYMNVSVHDGRFEIGSTWITPSLQRTAVNTEAKLLLLRHAFAVLGARRVELKTHARNEQSRRAIERIGARFEGIHRNHMLMPDGSMRDTAWYSIIDAEWPSVEAALESRLAAGGQGGASAVGAPSLRTPSASAGRA